MWEIIIAPKVKKRLAKTPVKLRERILTAIYELRNNPFDRDFKPVYGTSFWRLRVGDWRILFRTDRKEKILYAVFAGPRGNVYKG